MLQKKDEKTIGRPATGRKTGNVNVSLPLSLLETIDNLRAIDNLSRSKMVAILVRKGLEHEA